MTEVVGLDGCTVVCVHPEKVAMVWSNTPGEEDLSEVARVFKILGDPTRTRVLYALLEAGELCVCDLAAATGISEATLSQSLRLLRASRVVTGRREGRNVFYRLSDMHVRMLLDITREHVTHDHNAPHAASDETAT
ncbi:metalloregulator ArsR/SmtB family transcription factor [Nocardioides salsibiostraticola]